MVIAIISSRWRTASHSLWAVPLFFRCWTNTKQICKERLLFLFFNILVFRFVKSLASLCPIDYFRGRLVSIWVFGSVLLIQRRLITSIFTLIKCDQWSSTASELWLRPTLIWVLKCALKSFFDTRKRFFEKIDDTCSSPIFLSLIIIFIFFIFPAIWWLIF